MSLSDHVQIVITSGGLSVARANFGVPLILSVNAAWAERTRTYTDIDGVAADFATTSPEYLAATALFSQEPHPETIMIGRAAGKPTQRYKVTATVVENTHTYSLVVKGEGFVETTVTFTSDGTALDAEIAAGLVTALNLVAGKNFTASGASSPISITGNTVGAWFSVESAQPTYLKIEQDHAEPATTIANDIIAIRAETDAWYILYTLYNSDAYVKAAAAAIEPLKKMYVADLSASESATLAVSGGDTGDDLKALNYDRTITVYHPNPGYMNGAAWMGERLPYDPGAATWKFSQPDGVPAVNLTSTQTTNLVAKNINFLQTTAGVDIMREGVTVGGEFIDKIRDLDWLEDDMTKSVFETLAGSPKVPYTDAGVAQIEAAVRGSLTRAYGLGIIDKDFVITVPRVANTSTSDRALRILRNVKFSCRMQGAIHSVRISGLVSV